MAKIVQKIIGPDGKERKLIIDTAKKSFVFKGYAKDFKKKKEDEK